MKEARKRLEMSQAEMAEALGWGARQISNIETGARPMTVQTGLAIECLLRRAGVFTALNGAKANAKESEE